MPQRISAVNHEYAGRRLRVGEAFECEPIHIALMLALGRIRPERGEQGYVERDEQAYLTREMTAARQRRARQA